MPTCPPRMTLCRRALHGGVFALDAPIEAFRVVATPDAVFALAMQPRGPAPDLESTLDIEAPTDQFLHRLEFP